jgi:hypothetical protein
MKENIVRQLTYPAVKYQLTFIVSSEVFEVTSNSYRVIEELYFALGARLCPRMWAIERGGPVLL